MAKTYYTIELFPQQSLTIENIPESHFLDAVEGMLHRKGLRSYRYKDAFTIADSRKLTAYYTNEEKRNEMVSALLASGDYLSNHTFFLPPGYGDFMYHEKG